MMDDKGCLVTIDFSDEIDDIFAKLTIAPTERGRIAWELWKKNPNSFTIAPAYLSTIDDKNNVVQNELIGLSLISKRPGKKNDQCMYTIKEQSQQPLTLY